MRDAKQVEKIVETALEVSYSDESLMDRITRLRAARTLAHEAGLENKVKKIEVRLSELE